MESNVHCQLEGSAIWVENRLPANRPDWPNCVLKSALSRTNASGDTIRQAGDMQWWSDER